MTVARILVIDDNAANLALMVYLLKAVGYDVSSATDGLQGLVSATAAKFDLVLCDILMPGIDGFEFARRFRDDPSNSGCKLVAVTALAMVGDKERVLAAGFDAYIAKPIEPEQFITQISEYLSIPGATTEMLPLQTLQPEPPLEGPVVLAVDDVPVNIDVIRGSLEPFGFRIVSAHNAVEAIELCAKIKPDVILCDLHMPHGDGFSLVSQIKSSTELASIPFLFISSTTWHSSEKERALKMGALKFLHRPIEPKQLLVEIKNALATT